MKSRKSIYSFAIYQLKTLVCTLIGGSENGFVVKSKRTNFPPKYTPD